VPGPKSSAHLRGEISKGVYLPNYNTNKITVLGALFFTIFFSFLVSLKAYSEDLGDFSGPSAVVFGDSIASGAATHSKMEFDGDVLWEILNGRRDVTAQKVDTPILTELELEPPTLVFPTQSEIMNHPFTTSSEVLMQSLGSLFLNTEEYSWAYQVSRKLGVSGKKVYFASSNGARSADFSVQVQRFLTRSKGSLPKYIFVMFTGNDLCSPYGQGVTSPDLFHANLESGLKMLSEASHHLEGTRVFLAGVLPITQLYQSSSILDKKVRAHGAEVSCRELRESSFVRPESNPPKHAIPAMFTQIFPPNPSLMCPNLFAPEKSMKDQISELATTAGLYRDQIEKLHSAFAGKSNTFKVEYLKDLQKLTLAGEDIAQDCFHLSVQGQSKVAAKVLETMK